MKNRIFVAFILNLSFSIFELFGGIFTGSIAILSDAFHDFGDAVSIGISALFERKSHRKPDSVYTYGYRRYSVLSGFIMWSILLIGSAVIVYNSLLKLFNPTPVNYNGMLIFAIFGTVTNILAAVLTSKGGNHNEKAVSFHLLEDALGWVTVLVGALLMKFTDMSIIDPIISLGLAFFIIFNALKGMRDILYLFLDKAPRGLDAKTVEAAVLEVKNVKSVHCIHIRSLDGTSVLAAMHIVTNRDFKAVKTAVKKKLRQLGICHAVLETEAVGEECEEMN